MNKNEKAQRCTCPSGDGSLRWPCPAPPAEAQAQGGGEVPEAELIALVAGPYHYHHKMDEAAEREGKAFDRCRELTIQNIRTWCATRRAMLRTTPPSAPVGVDLREAAAALLKAFDDSEHPFIAAGAAERVRTALAQQPTADEVAAEQFRKGWQAGYAAGQWRAAADGALSASEAVYAFAAWMTCLPRPIPVGSTADAAPVAALVGRFCDAQGFAAPQDDYHTRIKPVAAIAQQPAAVDVACAAAAIQFALTDPEGMTFLRLWNEGDFDTLRREWPDAPIEVYVGADPLAAQPGGSDNDQ